MSLRGAMAGQYPQGKWNKSLGCQSKERFPVTEDRVWHLIVLVIKIKAMERKEDWQVTVDDKIAGVHERSDQARVYYSASQEATP